MIDRTPKVAADKKTPTRTHDSTTVVMCLRLRLRCVLVIGLLLRSFVGCSRALVSTRVGATVCPGKQSQDCFLEGKGFPTWKPFPFDGYDFLILSPSNTFRTC